MFDPNTFMQATLTEANDTRIMPCPVGEYQMQIVDIKAKSGTIGKGERAGETWAGLDVFCEVDDPQVKAATGRTVVRVKHSLMLDLTPEGMLDMGKGKNIRLGKVRAACGLNRPGQAFSFPQMIGQRVVGVVGHRPDDRDPSIIYDEVTAVRAI